MSATPSPSASANTVNSTGGSDVRVPQAKVSIDINAWYLVPCIDNNADTTVSSLVVTPVAKASSAKFV